MTISTNIRLYNLVTFEDHTKACEEIENNWANWDGNFLNGREVTLKPAAKKKIAAIWEQIYKRFPD